MKFRISELVDLLKYKVKRPSLALAMSLLWLCALSYLAFLWNLGHGGLVDETEPLFAEAARQMTVTGDWITPYFNGQTRFDKPPLIYWLMAIAYHTFGVNILAVRLPSAVAAIALTCLGFYTLYYCKRDGEMEDGNLSSAPVPPISLFPAGIGSALIALNPETIAWGRIGVSDMLLTGCMCSALFAFFLGYVKEEEKKNQEEEAKLKTASSYEESSNLWETLPETKQSLKTGKHGESKAISKLSRWYLAFYILIALAILTKGPVGIVLPVIIIGSFTLYLGNSREIWQEMRPLRGILIILAIALPWFILVTLANGETYIDSFFGYHNFQRFTQVVNRHGAPWYFYFVVVLVGFAPWSIYLPCAIARLRFWQRSYWCRQPRKAQLGLFALCWFACIFGFFTVAVTKLPSYVLPLMPAAAILVALLWSEIIEDKVTGEKERITLAIGNIQDFTEKLSVDSDDRLVAEGKIIHKAAKIEQDSLPLSLFLSLIFNVIFLLVLAGAILYSFHWLGNDPAMPNFSQAFQQSGLPIAGGAIWGIAAVVAAILLWRRQEHWILTVNLIGLAAFLIFIITPVYNLVDEQRQLPLRQLAHTAVEEKLPSEELIMIGFPKPSLVFYTQDSVTYYRLTRAAIEYIQKSQSQSPPSVLILGYPEKFTQIGLQPNQYQILDTKGAYQLARVSKQMFANSKANAFVG
ncbi:glycosyltransferase family 39 protein [Kamptonema sp. UHCC 0994]|uniref:ArnT family glycosyltransferase n=1 Tax=Kamptonema sp. UHCC 0994 TaxID=3031329 RepID=UPI0023BA2CA5|nr:glycosyltransferase family 39 protein [Kamptonema sp. UHCC 0994]MDF0551864.1 glycosyltransferase family 39 protein [Kamptonema sp. UHCC 0994]